MNEPTGWNRWRGVGALGAFAVVVLLASAWMIIGPTLVSEDGGFQLRRRAKGGLADEFRRQREEAATRAAPRADASDASTQAPLPSGINVTGGRALADEILASSPAPGVGAAAGPFGGRSGGGAGSGAAGGSTEAAGAAAIGPDGRRVGAWGAGSAADPNAGAAPIAAAATPKGETGPQAGAPKLDLSRTLSAFSQSGKAVIGREGSGATTGARVSLTMPGASGSGATMTGGRGGSVSGSGGGEGSAGGHASSAGGGATGSGGSSLPQGYAAAASTTELDEAAKKCDKSNQAQAEEKAAQERLAQASKALGDAECKAHCNYGQDNWCRLNCPGAGWISCLQCRCIQLGCNWRRACEEAERLRCAAMKGCPFTANQNCSMDCVR